MAKNERPKQIAERFGMPITWAREHIGIHECVDGFHYQSSCLVRDPDWHDTAILYMSGATNLVRAV